MKIPLVILTIAGFLFLLSCCKDQDSEIIAKKTPTILTNFLNSEDPVEFAKTHGIKLKDGMVRVVMTVDEGFLSKDLVSKYGLEDFKKRRNIMASYVTIDSLKELCKEPSIMFIRLPVKLRGMGETTEGKVEIEK